MQHQHRSPLPHARFPMFWHKSKARTQFIADIRPEKGGLTANNSVYRYNTEKSDDGVGGEEGAFSLCTLWCIEAMTRAGVYDKPYLDRA